MRRHLANTVAELASPDQRAPITAVSRLIPAHVATLEAMSVLSLPLRIIDALGEVEPHHRVGWTMSLRLILVAKNRERKSKCGCRTRDQDKQDKCEAASHARHLTMEPGSLHDRGRVILIQTCSSERDAAQPRDHLPRPPPPSNRKRPAPKLGHWPKRSNTGSNRARNCPKVPYGVERYGPPCVT
jgi:hypothetical protein